MNIFIEQARRRNQMLDLVNDYGKQLLEEAMQKDPATCAEKYEQDLSEGDEDQEVQAEQLEYENWYYGSMRSDENE